jgi:hypothetical protein
VAALDAMSMGEPHKRLFLEGNARRVFKLA